jgi:hypothetical protein
VRAGHVHGPHGTQNGCKLPALWTERTTSEAANLGDFLLPAAVKAAA